MVLVTFRESKEKQGQFPGKFLPSSWLASSIILVIGLSVTTKYRTRFIQVSEVETLSLMKLWSYALKNFHVMKGGVRKTNN